jgi:hypothetical protein
LLNEVFQLGIAKQDLSFETVLRNSHVARTKIPSILKKHVKSVRHGEFQRLRNDIVHRGKLDLAELEEIQTCLVELQLVGIFEPEQVTAARADLTKRIREFSGARAAEFRAHLSSTVIMLNEILVELRRTATSRCAREDGV